MLRRLLLISIFLLSALQMQAQHLLGFAGSNYAGTNAIFLNPSSIADAKQGFYLNLFGGHLTFANTYFYYDGPGLQPSVIMEDPENVVGGDGLFDRSRIQERLDGKPKMAHFGIDLRLPSFMLKFSPHHSIALTTRLRTAFQANNVSEDLARVIGFGTANPALQNTPFSGSEAYFNANAFTETGFTYALVLLSQEKRFLKGGITVKKLSGLYSAHLLAPEVDYQLMQNQEGESYMQIQQGSGSFGFSRSDYENLEEQEVLDALIGRNSPGTGWGVDIGFTYEHRPRYADYQYTLDGKERTDHGENKYRYRIVVALLDVGSITYKDPEHVRAYNITRQNLNLNGETFEDVSLDDLGPTLEEALEVQSSERKTEIVSGLPTTLHLNFDYRIARNLFLNTAVLHNLRNKETVSMFQPSALAVTPRLEGKKLELALPVYLANNYQDLNFGAMLRLGSFVVGSNNLAAFIPSNKAVGPDLYMGLGISIGTGGNRAKMEKKAQKKANKERRKSEKEQKKINTSNPVPTTTPPPTASLQEPVSGSQSSPAPVSQAIAPASSPGTAPINAQTVAAPVESGNATSNSLESTPTDTLSSLAIDSVGTVPADSLSETVIETAKTPAGDSLTTTTVKSLENAQPASISETTPATKAESGTVPIPGTNKEATPATTPAATPQLVAPKKAVNN